MNMIAHIVVNEFELGIGAVTGNIHKVAGDEIVHGYNVVAVGQQAIDKMRSEKTSSTSDEDPQCPTPR